MIKRNGIKQTSPIICQKNILNSTIFFLANHCVEKRALASIVPGYRATTEHVNINSKLSKTILWGQRWQRNELRDISGSQW